MDDLDLYENQRQTPWPFDYFHSWVCAIEIFSNIPPCPVSFADIPYKLQVHMQHVLCPGYGRSSWHYLGNDFYTAQNSSSVYISNWLCGEFRISTDLSALLTELRTGRQNQVGGLLYPALEEYRVQHDVEEGK